MNIAVINLKDMFKYFFRILIIICVILFIIKGLKKIDTTKQEESIKETISNKTKQINEYSFLNCLDLSISLMSYDKTNENKEENILTNGKILAMGAGIFDESVFEQSGLVINKEDLSIDDVEELANQVAELPYNVKVESVDENNIKPKVTSSYGTVQINNQSDYEITEQMLVPDVEIKNKRDILIYHTHTCESYTPSPRIRI